MTAKNLDNKNRQRSVTVGFRVSPEEAKRLDMAVALSGMNKQVFLFSRALDRQVVVAISCKVHRAVIVKLKSFLNELSRIEAGAM